jgi:hypothetical protein
MNQGNRPHEKSAWHDPEIVDVGGVVETTGNGPENVRDNQGSDPPGYNPSRMSSSEEVDLEGR